MTRNYFCSVRTQIGTNRTTNIQISRGDWSGKRYERALWFDSDNYFHIVAPCRTSHIKNVSTFEWRFFFDRFLWDMGNRIVLLDEVDDEVFILYSEELSVIGHELRASFPFHFQIGSKWRK